MTLRWIAGFLVLLLALALPARVGELAALKDPSLPIELPIIVLALVLVRLRALRIVVAALLAPLIILKLADMAVHFFFARPLNLVVDTLMAPVALDTLLRANVLLAAAGVIGIMLLIGVLSFALYWAASQVQDTPYPKPIAGVAVVALGVAIVMNNAASSTLMRDHVAAVAEDLRAARTFGAELAKDDAVNIPREQQLAGLKGADVLLVFVESYGRSALDNPDYAPAVRARLETFDAALARTGLSARSAWLTSPTYGGESYLAHSSFLSGLWIDNRLRFAQLLRSGRRTLMHDFRDAGWRTVGVMPVITGPWPEGDFFGYDKLLDAPNLNFGGQSFGYMTMPDQYALSVFQKTELAPGERKPVMAEIALISSHIPWTPLPKFVPWEEVGDGRIFDIARTTENSDAIWREPKRLREYYAMSLDYVLETLQSFAVTYGAGDMLLIIVGDHQPMGFMADSEARDVPIHIISKDPARLAALGADWAAGMTPAAGSPIQPMNAMRARILRAFSPDGTVAQ